MSAVRPSALIPLIFFVGQPFVGAQTTSVGIAPLAYRPPEPGQLPANTPQQDQQNVPDALKLPKTVSAPPFTVHDKWDYRVVQSFGLRGLLGATVSSGIGQATSTPYEWGGGVEGFAKRYASSFAGNLSRQTFAFALESALHEDPRYFPSEGAPFKVRVLNAMKQVVVCKTDQGRSSFAYARVASAFAAGQFVNVWEPDSNNGIGDGFERGLFSLSGDFAYNLMQEFFRFTRPRSLRHRD